MPICLRDYAQKFHKESSALFSDLSSRSASVQAIVYIIVNALKLDYWAFLSLRMDDLHTICSSKIMLCVW